MLLRGCGGGSSQASASNAPDYLNVEEDLKEWLITHIQENEFSKEGLLPTWIQQFLTKRRFDYTLGIEILTKTLSTNMPELGQYTIEELIYIFTDLDSDFGTTLLTPLQVTIYNILKDIDNIRLELQKTYMDNVPIIESIKEWLEGNPKKQIKDESSLSSDLKSCIKKFRDNFNKFIQQLSDKAEENKENNVTWNKIHNAIEKLNKK